MRGILAVIMVLACFSMQASAMESIKTGDWKKLTKQRKIYFVLGTMEEWQTQKRMTFRHTMEEYIEWFDKNASQTAPESEMAALFSKAVYMLEKPKPSSYQ